MNKELGRNVLKVLQSVLITQIIITSAAEFFTGSLFPSNFKEISEPYWKQNTFIHWFGSCFSKHYSIISGESLNSFYSISSYEAHALHIF